MAESIWMSRRAGGCMGKDGPSLWEKAARAGIKVPSQPLEILPYPHDMVGGIKIDENGRTSVPGLFAAGETAGGAHGTGRIGGSALSEALAFGAICGENAAKILWIPADNL